MVALSKRGLINYINLDKPISYCSVCSIQEVNFQTLSLVRHLSVLRGCGNMLCMEDLEQHLGWLRRPI